MNHECVPGRRLLRPGITRRDRSLASAWKAGAHQRVTPLPFVLLQTSVLHMCSLFHAFIFAQLWTVYCEQSAVAPNVQSQNEFSFTAILTALEFWSRVTPSILQLMAHNKVVSSQKSVPSRLESRHVDSLPALTRPVLKISAVVVSKPMGGFLCYKLDVLPTRKLPWKTKQTSQFSKNDFCFLCSLPKETYETSTIKGCFAAINSEG